VAELVDATGLGPVGRKPLEVRVLSPALLACVAALAAGCSRDEDGDEQAARPVPTWPGPPRAGSDGTMAVAGFNAFLRRRPELAGSPLRAGIDYTRIDRVQARTTAAFVRSGPEGRPPTVVVLTADGLLDDSVRAQRYTLVFRRAGEGWRLVSARRTQRCWPGRGHGAFSPRPCV
jgi:hypothetical protein